MELGKIVCDGCGGRSFIRKGDSYECEYCGSSYIIENDENVVSKTLTDAQIIEYYLEATKYMLANNYSEEFKALSKALDLAPNNALTLVKLGRCYRNLGLQDKAIESYQKALEIDPSLGTAYTNLGTIYILNQKWSEAATQYQMGLPLIDQKEDDYWTAYANYAIAVAKLGDTTRANNMIKEAEQHGYKNGNTCRSLAGIKAQGCYVATCVYGSYDCPQVWTLRRYRDDTLGATLYGRLFIRTYYAISPTLVKWFGNTTWFKKLCKGKLDHMVAKLQAEGVKDTPYEDKEW